MTMKPVVIQLKWVRRVSHKNQDRSHCLAWLSLSDLCLCVVCYLLVIIKLSGAFMSGTQHEEDNEAKLPFTNGYRNVIIFSIYWHLFLMANRKHRMVE